MAGRFFLDTNVFVYAFDAHSSKRNKALQLIGRAADTGEGVVSYQVVQEFFNLALRRFSPAMSMAEAEQFLITVFRPLLAVHSSPNLYFEGLRIADRNRLAWYDSLIVAAAEEAKCETLYSENFNHGQKIGALRIENPFV